MKITTCLVCGEKARERKIGNFKIEYLHGEVSKNGFALFLVDRSCHQKIDLWWSEIATRTQFQLRRNKDNRLFLFEKRENGKIFRFGTTALAI